MRMSIWGSYENLSEIFYWLDYTKICTNENYLLYGIYSVPLPPGSDKTIISQVVHNKSIYIRVS